MKKILLLLVALISLVSGVQAQGILDENSNQNWFYLGTGEHISPLRRKTVECEVAVIGAGMSGISAAVAAARQGADVVLINDRAVLGGNASSEIRVTVNGPSFERTTGIVEEILLENRKYNPQFSYPVWDHVLFDYVTREPNITLMLNTSAIKAVTKANKIESVICWQMNTETEVTIKAPIFIDCTGDGTIAASAGAEYRTGREGKDEFGEEYAPDKPDGWVMGESIMMITRDMGEPTPFYAPSFAKEFIPSKAKHRQVRTLKEGYWWVELGSEYDVIADRPQNRDDLLGYLYGVWNYVKNSGEYPEAANLVLDWVGSLPGKRESRRIMGDYILSEGDLRGCKIFDDAIAWGGWPLDEHAPGGILSPNEPASYFHEHFKKPYQIPYRSIYSKNIENLLMAGRNVSVSHIALSSTRIIETCSAMGQAAGVAAAMCVESNSSPRGIYQTQIEELQERLLREDYYIPYRPAMDSDNLAKSARITPSSTSSGSVKNLTDGVARDEQGEIHHWQSKESSASLNLKWKKEMQVSSVELKFDTSLYRDIMMHKNPDKHKNQIAGIPPELVKDFTISALIDGEWIEIATVKDNIKRYVPINFESINTKELRIDMHNTYGAESIKLFELRCY